MKNPKCHIVGCGAKKTKKRPELSFHQLPKNNAKRLKWLEIIGVENIINDSSTIYICSLHFDESCFNKTVSCIKLREEALPSLLLPPGSKLSDPTGNVIASSMSSDKVSKGSKCSVSEGQITMRHVIDIAPIFTPEPPANLKMLSKRKLEEKCVKQQKRIKWLQEKLYAGVKEIAALKDRLSNDQKERVDDGPIVIIPEEDEG